MKKKMKRNMKKNMKKKILLSVVSFSLAVGAGAHAGGMEFRHR